MQRHQFPSSFLYRVPETESTSDNYSKKLNIQFQRFFGSVT